MNRATELWNEIVKKADRFPPWAPGAYNQVGVPKKELEEDVLYVLEQKGEPVYIIKIINTYHDDPDNNDSNKKYKSDILNIVYRLIKVSKNVGKKNEWKDVDKDEPLKTYQFDKMALDENDRHLWKKATFWKPARLLTGGGRRQAQRKTRRSKRA